MGQPTKVLCLSRTNNHVQTHQDHTAENANVIVFPWHVCLPKTSSTKTTHSRPTNHHAKVAAEIIYELIILAWRTPNPMAKLLSVPPQLLPIFSGRMFYSRFILNPTNKGVSLKLRKTLLIGFLGLASVWYINKQRPRVRYLLESVSAWQNFPHSLKQQKMQLLEL